MGGNNSNNQLQLQNVSKWRLMFEDIKDDARKMGFKVDDLPKTPNNRCLTVTFCEYPAADECYIKIVQRSVTLFDSMEAAIAYAYTKAVAIQKEEKGKYVSKAVYRGDLPIVNLQSPDDEYDIGYSYDFFYSLIH